MTKKYNPLLKLGFDLDPNAIDIRERLKTLEGDERLPASAVAGVATIEYVNEQIGDIETLLASI